MNPIRVLLADDHTLVRAGFRALLQRLPDVEIVAEARDGHEALRLIQAHQPDVVLLDIAMPGPSGLEVAERAAREFPNMRVIMLSMYANEEYVIRALRTGATGYLLKGADADELELAVRAVVRGETYLSPPVSRQILEDYMRRAGAEPRSFDRLTPRQREVVRLIAQGRTSKEIAQALDISLKTVETHRAQAMKELDIHDITGLVRYAIQTGLVVPNQ